MKIVIFTGLLVLATALPAPQQVSLPDGAPATKEGGSEEGGKSKSLQDQFTENKDKIKAHVVHAIKSFVPASVLEEWAKVGTVDTIP